MRVIKKSIKYFFLILFAVIQIYPFVWMLFFSIKNNYDIFGGNVMGFPKILHFENYEKAVHQGEVLIFFRNSTIVTLISIAVTTLLSLMVAYAVSRLYWKYGKHLLIFFLIGIMIPVQAVVLPVFITIHKIGLYNTHLSLIIVDTAMAMPTAIFIMSAYMRNLPRELEESAALDGAGVYRIFFRIIVPIVKPVIVASIILSFIAIWNEFMMAYMLIGDSKFFTLTVGLFAMQGSYTTNWGMMGAGMVICSFPTLILYLLLSKKVQESFIMGAVKG